MRWLRARIRRWVLGRVEAWYPEYAVVPALPAGVRRVIVEYEWGARLLDLGEPIGQRLCMLWSGPGMPAGWRDWIKGGREEV